VEGQGGEDGRLGRGVEALDVGRGVGLRVPQLGGLFQRLAETGAGSVHRREDEVGGAVDDAGDPGDPVAVQRLAQRAQQRDRAGDRRLVVEIGAALGRRVVQRGAVLGEQRLVRRDHALATAQRLDQPGAGRLDAAHHLDHDVDVVALDQAERVGGEQVFLDGKVTALAAEPPDRDADDLQRGADPGRQVVSLMVQQADDFRADGAAAQEGQADRFTHAHPTSNASRSSSVSRRTITREAPSRTATTGGRGTWL
jgi:hypothetical protein